MLQMVARGSTPDKTNPDSCVAENLKQCGSWGRGTAARIVYRKTKTEQKARSTIVCVKSRQEARVDARGGQPNREEACAHKAAAGELGTVRRRGAGPLTFMTRVRQGNRAQSGCGARPVGQAKVSTKPGEHKTQAMREHTTMMADSG